MVTIYEKRFSVNWITNQRITNETYEYTNKNNFLIRLFLPAGRQVR